MFAGAGGRRIFYLLDITYYYPLCISSLSILIFTPSIIFLCLIRIISYFVFRWGYKYIIADHTPRRFFWLLFSFVCSILVLVLSNSFFSIIVGWDGLGLTRFLLIIYYSRKYSVDCSFLTLLTNRIGDVIFIILFPVFFILGNDCLRWQCRWSFRWFIFWVIAAFTKRAQFPFIRWLPAAIAAPTPVRALVHRRTLVTAGLWVILRLGMEGFWAPEIINWIIWFGIITRLLRGILALFEQDVKKLIAFRTLRQLGLITTILRLGIFWLTLFHICTHALFKAMLFIRAGTLMMMNWGNQSLRLIKGFVGPGKRVIFCIASFNLWGLPFLSAYVSKHMIYRHIIIRRISIISILIFILGLILSASYTFRIISRVLISNYQIVCKVELKDKIIIFSLRRLCLFRILAGQIFFISIFVIREESTTVFISRLRYIIVGISIFIFINSSSSWFKSSLFSFSENLNKNLISLTYMINESKTVFSPKFLINKKSSSSSLNLNLNIRGLTRSFRFLSCLIIITISLILAFY